MVSINELLSIRNQELKKNHQTYIKNGGELPFRQWCYKCATPTAKEIQKKLQ